MDFIIGRKCHSSDGHSLRGARGCQAVAAAQGGVGLPYTNNRCPVTDFFSCPSGRYCPHGWMSAVKTIWSSMAMHTDVSTPTPTLTHNPTNTQPHSQPLPLPLASTPSAHTTQTSCCAPH
eukprot:scaffold178956_cov24-Tisochrysis_lutea.AAC.2